MKEKLIDIGLFLITVRSEIDAFAETRTRHDRQRASLALAHLTKQIVELKDELMNVQLRREGE